MCHWTMGLNNDKTFKVFCINIIYRTAPFFNDLERSTPIPSFKVTPFFDAEYIRNRTRYRQCNEILIETYALLNIVISNDLEWPWMTWQNIQWHEASRGLSATAELLVSPYGSQIIISIKHLHEIPRSHPLRGAKYRWCIKISRFLPCDAYA